MANVRVRQSPLETDDVDIIVAGHCDAALTDAGQALESHLNRCRGRIPVEQARWDAAAVGQSELSTCCVNDDLLDLIRLLCIEPGQRRRGQQSHVIHSGGAVIDVEHVTFAKSIGERSRARAQVRVGLEQGDVLRPECALEVNPVDIARLGDVHQARGGARDSSGVDCRAERSDDAGGERIERDLRSRPRHSVNRDRQRVVTAGGVDRQLLDLVHGMDRRAVGG